MATSYYSAGSITLTNGSAVVTGTGTAWSTALIASGNIFVQAPGNPLPIGTVDSDTQITAQLEWTGASGTYEYNIQLDPSLANSALNATNLAYLLSELRQGTIFKYDASGTLVDRDLFDGRSKGFSYLVTEDDTAYLYVKASNTSGDWAGPFAYGTGPVGPAADLGIGTVSTLAPGSPATASVTGTDGDYDLNLGIPAGLIGLTFLGEYNPATAYSLRDAVRFNGSTYITLQATTGNAPPNLPTTSNAYWEVMAAKGLDGTGVGDMVKSTYDPQNLQVDAFARGNHTGDIPDSVLIADGTRKGRFDVGAVTAGQSRVYTMPDRDLVINPAWERAGIINLAGLSFAVFPDLAAFRSLRLRVEALPPGSAGVPFLRVSQDNGATWNQGASHYGFAGLGVSGSSIGAAGTAPSSYFQVGGGLSANIMELEAVFTEFNKARATIIRSNCSHFNETAVHAKVEYWGYRADPLTHNALLFGTTSGLAFVNGTAILEGIRG